MGKLRLVSSFFRSKFMSPLFFLLFSISSTVVKCRNQTNLNGSSIPSSSNPQSQTIVSLSSPNTGIHGTFTARIPVHILPSNQIIDYFPWEIEIGRAACPYTGMLVTARRGFISKNSSEEETLDDLRNLPSPHCSVECECMATGDYRCRSICPSPPEDTDFCVPVQIPGECCHRYVCDDELDIMFPTLQYPEASNASSAGNSSTLLLCLPGSVLPDSLCHSFFPKAFSGHLGPKSICFGYDDIRCAWLEDNEVSISGNFAEEKAVNARSGRNHAMTQTIFFQTALNGTVFSTNVPLKKPRKKHFSNDWCDHPLRFSNCTHFLCEEGHGLNLQQKSVWLKCGTVPVPPFLFEMDTPIGRKWQKKGGREIDEKNQKDESDERSPGGCTMPLM